MLVVVGGQSRKVGKSAVVAGLIRALRKARWTAVKVSRHNHNVGPEQDVYELQEQTTPGATDSGRYLEAGAVRSYWLQVAGAEFKQAIPALRSILNASANTIIESNAVVPFIQPDVYLVVVNPSKTEWKETALRQLGYADTFVIVTHGANEPKAPMAIADLPEGIPTFVVMPPDYISTELAAYVGSKLSSGTSQAAKGKAISNDNPSSGPE